MRELGKQIIQVGILGILPMYFMLILISCCGVIFYDLHIKKENLNRTKGLQNTKKTYKYEQLYFKVDNVMAIFFFIFMTFFVVPFVITLDIRYDSYVKEVFLNRIDRISAILIGMTSIAMAMVVFVVLFDKEYYLLFSIRDVLQKYKFSVVLPITLGSFTLAEVCTLILPSDYVESIGGCVCLLLLQFATLYNIVGFGYITFTIIGIILGNNKKELLLLSQLYKRFWSDKIDTTQFKVEDQWTKDAIGINLQYLIEEYIKVCKKRKISEICNLEFVTSMDCYNEKWYKRAKTKYTFFVTIIWGISVFIDIIFLRDIGVWVIVINTIFTLLEIGAANLNMDCVRVVIMRLFSDTWGYYIFTEKDGEYLIPRVALRFDNVYDKFIQKMNSINAFFYIWIKYSKEDPNNLSNQIEKLYDELKQLGKKSIVTFLPLFTIGYFVFEKKFVKIECIQELYQEIVEQEGNKYQFERMIESQIYYLTTNSTEERDMLKATMKKYLRWISRKKIKNY